MANSSSPTAPLPENLWERAAARLQEKDKQSMIDCNTTINLKEILYTVEVEKGSCESKRWVVKRGPDKDPIVLRDVFSKMAGWIEKFIAVGDTAVQYNPGHAALPWAAVKFVLQASVQDIRRHASVLEGIERVSSIITRCTVVESLYFRQQMKATKDAKITIVNLYVIILSFLAKATRYFKKGTLRRTVGSVSDFDNKFQSKLKTIAEEETEFLRYADILRAEYQKSELETMSADRKSYDKRLRTLLGDMQSPINRIEKQLQSYEDDLQEAERIEILNWLSPIPYLQHHSQIKTHVLAGTGQWLLDHDTLLDWQYSESSSILWLHGIPGSGKSTVVSLLIEHLKKRNSHGNGSYPPFFYCNSNPTERVRASPEEIFRSLVRQLSCHSDGQGIESLTKDIYKERKRTAFAAGPLSLEESISTIIKLSGNRPRSIIVIDALDECDPRERKHLLDGLLKIVKDTTTSVKVFVSSRDDGDIVDQMSVFPTIESAEEQNQRDIDSFVNSEVDKYIEKKWLLGGKVPEALHQKIKDTLRKQAQGMFRWVSLQLQYLSTIKLVGLVEERLGRLPQRLHKIYEETYKKRFCEYADEEKALVQCALRWLLCSEVPLDTETFLRLTSSSSYQKGVDELSRDTLLGLCFNFIVHDAELDIFRFAHLSVREYLESVDSYQLDASHAFAAGYCLNLLMFKLTIKPELHPSEARTQDDAPGLAVIEYTHFFWGAHLKRCGRHRFSEPLRTLFSDFTLDQYGVSSSFSHWNENCYSIENSDDLHDTRKQRSGGILPRIRHSFWESPCRVSQMLSHPANVLFTASFWDFEELMERWTNMNPECKDIRNQDCRKARGIACQRGSFKVVRLLIEHFVPIEEESAHHKSERHQDLTRAFESAVCCGHTDTVHILVEKRVIPDAWAYALKSAVFWGNANIVKMLLENDIDLCAKDCVGPATVYTSSSVFFKAIYGGHMGIVKMLCEVAGVREASQGPWLAGTELMRTLRDRGGVTTLLQREGFKDLVDKAALAPAVFLSLEHSDFETAGTLVTMGADPNFQWENSEGSSILREAIYKSTYIPRAAAFVELMLDYGADVDRCCSADQSTPIEFAVNFGGEAAVALLLKKNARCDRVDYPIVFPRPSGVVGSLFDIAESRGYLAIAQLLKEHGCVSAKSCPQSHDSWSWKCWKSKRY